MWEEYVGIIGGNIKLANNNRTDNGEGKPLCTCICCTLISIENSQVTL
jgi:hypothetical protein